MNGPGQVQFGLYDARFEHDACGVGFVADARGRSSHDIIRTALIALSRLGHRGGVNADGISGDGAGVLTQIPRPFFARVMGEAGCSPENPDQVAVGVVFLPASDESAKLAAIERIVATLERLKMPISCWRDVPIERGVLGREAAATCPDIRQFVVPRPAGWDEDEFERELYRARKLITAALLRERIKSVTIASLSSRTMVYKGLMVAPQLAAFYPDLADPLFKSALAVFHQRFSTNTLPRWDLAQPFHRLGHNGEINTIQGNINRFNAAFHETRSNVWGGKLNDLDPVIEPGVSDSAALDSVFELLTLSGRDPLHAMMMLVPEAYQQNQAMPPELGAFYEYHAALMAPWDGPAAIAFSDGRIVAAALDRNGLRPMRYWILEDDLVIAGSETGLIDVPYARVIRSGRLGPGQLLAVDVIGQRLLLDDEIKQRTCARQPYQSWVEGNMIRGQAAAERSSERRTENIADLVRMRKAFAYGSEDVERVLEPMAQTGKEPVGSMGDDTPIVVLSQHPKTIYRYFKQIFAQVTNPPIDSLRERMVMSRRIALGSRGELLDESDHATCLVKFQSPIVITNEYEWLLSLGPPHFRLHTVDATFAVAHGPEGLEPALTRLCGEVEKAVDRGCSLIVLSDRKVSEERAPIPMLLATASAHHHLIRARKRMRCSLICDTGDVRDTHHFACLLGYGAALIHPYLALAGLNDLVSRDPRNRGLALPDAVANYRRAVEDGVLKIMAKRGISTMSGYRGAQIFEALGIAREVIDLHFAGTVSRIGGVRLPDLARDVLRFHAEAYGEDHRLGDRGIYHYRRNGEFHASNPTMNKVLHKAVRNSDQQEFLRYARLVDSRPPSQLRDLIQWKTAMRPLDVEEIEPAASIARRFCSQAMSLGAISPEAHESLAVAMNRLGAKSNSGEGGEDSARFYSGQPNGQLTSLAVWQPGAGDYRNSAVKQVASGRFGVTPEYLVSAEEIEIKMAQGAKPGEGGQIAGEKVSAYIARLRNALPGSMLISPPPHHDIYSIEDLGQLIYDLKRINPTARVGVKLVSVAGVGTIAAGVVKANADCVSVSGFDGGTGASALSSIKHAGLPWELGLAEVQQTLVLNQLRERVTVRVDGGMRTGRDVVIAALLGADEFGFGTAALVATGCVMVRQCHLNTCPVGIATQREDLRAKFPGTPDHVVAMMLFIAEHVRMILAEMGFARLEDIIGRVDLLETRADLKLPKTSGIDLSPMLSDPDPSRAQPRRRTWHRNERREGDIPLDEIVWRECMPAIVNRTAIKRSFVITNRDRSVGARLAGEIARHTRAKGLAAGSIELGFDGTSGQSFGAFCHAGMTLQLKGEAQDYVGKGMYGGVIVVAPANDHLENPVAMGNAVLYGATGGALFARGSAGERFCVRNSGGAAVVEGCGDHGCEYMTNGVAVVLGDVGRNFGAGMTGGVAYIYDHRPGLSRRIHGDSVEAHVLRDPLDHDLLKALLERHIHLTQSSRARQLLDAWEISRLRFSVIVPRSQNDERSIQLAELKENALTELNNGAATISAG